MTNVNSYMLKIILILLLFFKSIASFTKDFEENIRIIFGSCSNQNKAMKHWEYINSFKPNYLILLGDNVYGDFNTSVAKNLKDSYSKLNKNKYFYKLKKKSIILPIWDDHDFGKNDGGKNWIYKEQSKKIFLDFFNVNSNDKRRARDGIYFSYNIIGSRIKVKVLGLDTRYFKDEFKENKNKNIDKKYIPDNSPHKTILGTAQWKWLDNEIKDEYDVLLIMSSIQVLAKDHGWEKWYNFPHERKKLLDLININKKITIILSGDRHIGGFYKYNDYIYEITSSSFNQKTFNSFEKDEYIIGEVVTPNNFGFMEISERNKTINIELANGFYKDRRVFKSFKINF